MDEAAGGRKPVLVVVSGAPGAGKTVLAERLSGLLGLPVIGKDMLKETLADAMGTASLEQSQLLGLAAIRVMYAVAGELLRAGASAILESNFRRGLAETDLAPLLELSRAALIHCHAPADVCLSRYRERAESGKRHPTHFDRERLERADASGAAAPSPEHAPPDLPVPTLVVDTSDGYAPPLPYVVAWVRRVVGQAAARQATACRPAVNGRGYARRSLPAEAEERPEPA